MHLFGKDLDNEIKNYTYKGTAGSTSGLYTVTAGAIKLANSSSNPITSFQNAGKMTINIYEAGLLVNNKDWIEALDDFPTSIKIARKADTGSYLIYDVTAVTTSANINVKIVDITFVSQVGNTINVNDDVIITMAFKGNTGITNVIVSPLFNNDTAYYNMQTQLYLNGFPIAKMLYDTPFMDFGYKPTYNILSYLSNIDPIIFNSNKEFNAMPIFNNISTSLVYQGVAKSNRIELLPALKFEWDSIFIDTFVDIYTNGLFNPNMERYLILDKFYDSKVDRYVILFNKSVDLSGATTIGIVGRRKLSQISDDLQDLNNIQKPNRKKPLATLATINNYYNEVRSKYPTDSYTKILLSDNDIKKNVTGIVYIDHLSNLALNITNVDKVQTGSIISTYISSGYATFKALNHNLIIGDQISISMTGGLTSSQYLNKYDGIHVVRSVIDSDNFTTYRPGAALIANDPGTFTKNIFDPFLNYQPIDIIDVGVDKKIKRMVDVKHDNIIVSGSTHSLTRLNLNKFKINLTDGLSLSKIRESYPWLLEAEIDDALIGEDENGLVWYKGIWYCGRWFGGTWYSGTWVSGEWHAGTWNSLKISDRLTDVKVNNIQDSKESKWIDGNWINGTWNDGVWFNGIWDNGIHNNGVWFNGTWNNGTWNNGVFTGGNWINGKWNNGIFNSNAKKSNWVSGTWNGGDFESGDWFSGLFDQGHNKLSRFGTRSTNSRRSIWNGGAWITGEFHSNINSVDNIPGPAINNKYSQWRTGLWNSGKFFGGTTYNIDWKSGTWFTGVSNDISVVGITQSLTSGGVTQSALILDGEFKYNINDEVYVLDNNIGNTYSVFGSNTTPGKYSIIGIDISGGKTKILLNTINNVLASSDTGLKLVSNFANVDWKNGIWNNGIFNQGTWESGIFINGVFKDGSWTP